MNAITIHLNVVIVVEVVEDTDTDANLLPSGDGIGMLHHDVHESRRIILGKVNKRNKKKQGLLV